MSPALPSASSDTDSLLTQPKQDSTRSPVRAVRSVRRRCSTTSSASHTPSKLPCHLLSIAGKCAELSNLQQTPSPGGSSAGDSGLGSSILCSLGEQSTRQSSITPPSWHTATDQHPSDTPVESPRAFALSLTERLQNVQSKEQDHSAQPEPEPVPAVSCRWKSCKIMLHSLDDLATHLVQDHISPLQPKANRAARRSAPWSPSRANSRFVCQWLNEKLGTPCGNLKRFGSAADQFNWLKGHVTSRHAHNRIHKCVFEGCTVWTTSQSALSQHVNTVHVKPSLANNNEANKKKANRRRRPIYVRKIDACKDSMDARTVNSLVAFLFCSQ